MIMSALESMVASLTVGELAAKAGISVSTLVERAVDPTPITMAREQQEHQAECERASEGAMTAAHEGIARAGRARAERAQTVPKSGARERMPDPMPDLSTQAGRETLDNFVLRKLVGTGVIGSQPLLDAIGIEALSMIEMRASLERLMRDKLVTSSWRTRARKYMATARGVAKVRPAKD